MAAAVRANIRPERARVTASTRDGFAFAPQITRLARPPQTAAGHRLPHSPPAPQLEFAQQIPDVKRNCRGADGKAFGDFLIGQTGLD